MSCLVALCIIESLREIEMHRPPTLTILSTTFGGKANDALPFSAIPPDRNSRTRDNYKKTTRLYVKCMMELVQYFASHIGETIISFYNT